MRVLHFIRSSLGKPEINYHKYDSSENCYVINIRNAGIVKNGEFEIKEYSFTIYEVTAIYWYWDGTVPLSKVILVNN
jgi:hypothetical protein